jgi:hypothetical protein
LQTGSSTSKSLPFLQLINKGIAKDSVSLNLNIKKKFASMDMPRLVGEPPMSNQVRIYTTTPDVNPPIKYGMFVIRLKDPLHADGLKKSVTFGDYFRTLLESYVALKQEKKKKKTTLKTATSTTDRATISSPSGGEVSSSTASPHHHSRRHLLLTGEEAWLKQWSEPISETKGSRTPIPNHDHGLPGKMIEEPLHRPLTSKELPQQRKMLTLLGLSPLDEWPPPRCCHPKRSDRRHVCGSVH